MSGGDNVTVLIDNKSGIPIYDQIYSQIKAQIISGELQENEMLPSIRGLAKYLRISFITTKRAYEELEREGFITRRHGVGTIINRHVLNVQTRMDIEVEFLDMIRQSGKEPAVAYVRVSGGTADEKSAGQLQLNPGDAIVRVARLVTADGVPAIYCEDVIEKALAQGSYTINDLKLPIFHFLQQFCDVNPYLDLTDLRPVVADAALAEIFQVPMGSPLLNMDEVDFDIDGKPVFCSNEYFADGIFRHTVMRKKL